MIDKDIEAEKEAWVKKEATNKWEENCNRSYWTTWENGIRKNQTQIIAEKIIDLKREYDPIDMGDKAKVHNRKAFKNNFTVPYNQAIEDVLEILERN